MPVSSISQQFGVTVRVKRIAAQLSQEELAERAGLHPTYIGMVERGLRNPTLDASERIAKALKLTLSRLLEEVQNQQAKRANKPLRPFRHRESAT